MHTILCHLFSVNIKELVWRGKENAANQTQEEMGASDEGTKRERGTVHKNIGLKPIFMWICLKPLWQQHLSLQLKDMLQGLSLLGEHEDLLQKLKVPKAEEYNTDKIKMDTEVQVNLIWT